MSLAKLSLRYNNFYAPRYEIAIGGGKLPTEIANVITSVTVEEKMNEGAKFTINFYDEFDLGNQQFHLLDKNKDLFEVGNEIKISIGYESNLEEMVSGKITRLSPSFFSGETPSLTVEGYDLAFDIMKGDTSQDTFKEQTYSEIAQAIAQKANLKGVIDTTTGKVTLCKKNNESYFAFLTKLANDVGFQVWFSQDELYFKKASVDKQEILTLQYGKDIIRFQPKMDTINIVSEVEVRGNNPADPNKPFIGRAVAGSEMPQEGGKETASQLAKRCKKGNKKLINDARVTSNQAAKDKAIAELNKVSDSFITGEVECVGIPEIKPDVCVRLDKVGNCFSGKYHVTGAKHTINESGYKTTFNVKRNAR